MNLDKIKIYMEMAHVIKKLSPDSETQVGALMLSEDGRIVATSFNGFVRGAMDDLLPTTRPDKYKYILHSETNLLFNCSHEGIRTKNTTVICTLSPCHSCLQAMKTSGVKAVIFDALYRDAPDYDKLQDITTWQKPIGNYTVLELF